LDIEGAFNFLEQIPGILANYIVPRPVRIEKHAHHPAVGRLYLGSQRGDEVFR
jgi:hypothetical protein